LEWIADLPPIPRKPFMNRITLRSRVDTDGVLRLVVPFGEAEADQSMQVTIEPVPNEEVDSSDDIHSLEHLAGRWQGDFERLPVADFEQRESF